jgi:catechol 2,3-dioxygenase-like lactoylglutathione lyase family enzyme
MKRLHVHVGVSDLDQSIGFYSSLFGTEPTVVKKDYAKWMLDDPRVNFAISGGMHERKGIEHLGIQVDDGDELADVYGRLERAGRCLRKARQPAATQSRRKAGSPIPTALSGKRSTRAGRQRSTATARLSMLSSRPLRAMRSRRNAVLRQALHEPDADPAR